MTSRSRETATRRLLKSRNGASAVEFALVAPIFIALMLSIIEAGYFFFINSAVTEATAKASRLVRTGQAQAGIAPADFFNEICNVVDSFGDCDKQLTVDVARFDSFTDLANDLTSIQCRDSSNPAIAGAQFAAANYGARRDIVRVRICYLHRPVNPALGLRLSKNADGFREMVAVSVFRNEPFEN